MTFKVIANPWASIDEQARPTGRVAVVSNQEVVAGKFVGAKLVANQLVAKKTRKIGRYFETTQEAQFDRVWEFSSAPVDVESEGGRPSSYYLERIREGALIPADEACASACGVKFERPELAIERSKAARRSEFDAQHGAGAFDALQPAPAVAPAVENKKPPAAPKRAETPKE
jgi:hypothetical protein